MENLNLIRKCDRSRLTVSDVNCYFKRYALGLFYGYFSLVLDFFLDKALSTSNFLEIFQSEIYHFLCLPVSGKWPSLTLLARKRLTSGNICVKHVVKMTPPPKQESAEMKTWPRSKLQNLRKRSGSMPSNIDMLPSKVMERILAVKTSIIKPFSWDLRLKNSFVN